MTHRTRIALAALAAAVLLAGSARADLVSSLKQESPELKSAGPLAFGPEGILFVGDPQAAAVYAIDTGDRTAATSTDRPRVENLDQKLASLLGIEARQLLVADLAVNPISGNTYLSVARGKGPDGKAVLVRVERNGKVAELPLKGTRYARTALAKPAQGRGRQDAITHMAYVDGQLIVAGLSNEEFASKLRSIPFPFTAAVKETGVEIYHGSHGKFETRSPVRTFVPFDVNGQVNLLAAYTCTPLVRIPLADLRAGAKVKGTTIAELGNHNRPLDMIVYQKNGKNYLLIANNARGLMKVATDNIDKIDAITARVRDKAGLKYETVAGLKGVVQLDRFDKGHALVLVRTEDGALNLQTIALP